MFLVRVIELSIVVLISDFREDRDSLILGEPFRQIQIVCSSFRLRIVRLVAAIVRHTLVRLQIKLR